MTYEELLYPLKKVYEESEARAVARWLSEVVFNLTLTDLAGGALEKLSDADERRLREMQKQLLEGVPVQYVAGLADFGPRQFMVAPGVLIPRPETYELCRWIVDDQQERSAVQVAVEDDHSTAILDIGTGSGCIACTLAADLPSASLNAWDLSPDALQIARKNALHHQVTIEFKLCDVLKVCAGSDAGRWDLIVSNPPYVCDKEAAEMTHQVLDNEPKMALFVPDDDPLLFYRSIAHYAQSALQEGGRLYFEINPVYAAELKEMLLTLGFDTVIIRKDAFGKDRMMRATRR